MLIFSANARQLIDNAVASLDEPRQKAWRTWIAQQPVRRSAGDPLDDERGPLPAEIVNIVLSALEAMRDNLRRQLSAPGLSEDDISDLDNDVSHISSVERAVYQSLGHTRAMA